MKYMFCFGLGFSARTLAGKLARAGWKIGATSRSEAGASAIRALGYEAHVCNANSPLSAPAFAGVTHILSSVPPDSDGDPVLRLHRADLATLANQVEWAGYLSTTGVYGDHGGGLVTEDTPLTPNTERGNRRKAAEGDWLTLWEAYGLPVHIFRLAGIYGPGRNQLEFLRDGTAKRIIKAGQVFSRIHVEDIANVLEAQLPGRIRAAPTMSVTTSQRRPRMSWSMAPGFWVYPSQRTFLSRQLTFRPWHEVSMPIQNAFRTTGSRQNWA
jgi:nucleoside-diphosphate-sugar epimerase